LRNDLLERLGVLPERGVGGVHQPPCPHHRGVGEQQDRKDADFSQRGNARRGLLDRGRECRAMAERRRKATSGFCPAGFFPFATPGNLLLVPASQEVHVAVLSHEGTYPIMYGSYPVPVGAGYRRGYLARPDRAGRFPVVIVVPDLNGLSSFEKDICRTFA